MTKIIPYGRQHIDASDKKKVIEALGHDLITTGNVVKQFENKIKKYLKVKYVNSCNSGTSALHLSFMAINLSKNDNIILPAINFIAAANMAKNLGAKIFFADVDPVTGQVTPEQLIKCIKKNNLKKIKAFVTMYLGGNIEKKNILKIDEIKKKLKCFHIEDACHAFGAYYKVKNEKIMLGSCRHSDICTFSFHPLKSITTGEGGAVVTNDKKINQKITILKNHGMNKVKIKKKENFFISSTQIGFNYRLSDINSALGLSQIKRTNIFINKRKKIAKFYDMKFLKLDKYIKIQKIDKSTSSAFHLYLILVDFEKLKISRENFMKILLQNKIRTQVHYAPIYKHLIFFDIKKKNLDGCNKYYEKCLSIPIFYDLKINQANKVFKTISKIINEQTKLFNINTSKRN